jgi:hypothetical protein
MKRRTSVCKSLLFKFLNNSPNVLVFLMLSATLDVVNCFILFAKFDQVLDNLWISVIYLQTVIVSPMVYNTPVDLPLYSKYFAVCYYPIFFHFSVRISLIDSDFTLEQYHLIYNVTTS